MDAPADYKTAGTLMLVSGILNLLASVGILLIGLAVCIGVLWVVPMGFAIFEIVAATKVMNGHPEKNARTASILGLVAGITCLNPVTITLEAIALGKLGSPDVAGYLSKHAG